VIRHLVGYMRLNNDLMEQLQDELTRERAKTAQLEKQNRLLKMQLEAAQIRIEKLERIERMSQLPGTIRPQAG
jgi:hypothetical protein